MNTAGEYKSTKGFCDFFPFVSNFDAFLLAVHRSINQGFQRMDSVVQAPSSDTIDSSPKARAGDSGDEIPPPVAGTKLRLMCSYGGRIVPRPHDKSLCYVSGDTRIVVVDRQSSLADVAARLSKSLLNGRPFSLKYQLPSEDLDSLISVSTDEDLENMIDEYDRTSQSSHKPSRLRLFLFPTKTESASGSSIGSLLDSSTKSEDWFLNALNGANVLSAGFSESQSVNCLLGLDDDAKPSELPRDCGSFGNSKAGKSQDVHSVPDSPMMETSSSFGSTSSSPSLANLPPIRVRPADNAVSVAKVGIEEQISQMNLTGLQKPDDSFVILSSPPPIPTTIISTPIGLSASTGLDEYQNRVISDDEDRKLKNRSASSEIDEQKTLAASDLPYPDSILSESSAAVAQARQQPAVYQDHVVVPDPKLAMADRTARVHMVPQVHEPGFVLPSYDQQQQQFLHPAHYVQHLSPGPVPVSSYYQLYPSQAHAHHHHQMNQQIPVYLVPARSVQSYTSNIPASRMQASPAPTMASPSNFIPRNVPEIPPGARPSPPLNQQQYMGVSQIHHQSQHALPKSMANSGYEYADPPHSQVYYPQTLAPTLAPQYQTMSAAPAMVLSDANAQASAESMQQQIRTQPF